VFISSLSNSHNSIRCNSSWQILRNNFQGELRTLRVKKRRMTCLMYRSRSSNRKQNFCRLPWKRSTLRYSTRINITTTSSRVQSTIPQCFKTLCYRTHLPSVVSPTPLTRPTTTLHSQPLLNLTSTLRTWTSTLKDWKCSDSTLLNSSSLPT
jgi:hypothetical protein